MSNALLRARADLEAGRPWKARDRLTSLLVQRQDAEVVDLLVDVHLAMNNLPAAGVLMFVRERSDEAATRAIEAWRDHYGDEEAQWRSVPAPLRSPDQSARLRDLQRQARSVEELRWERRREEWKARADRSTPWTERVTDMLVLLAFVWTIVLCGVGAWTILQWWRG